MKKIKCPECRKSVSAEAATCQSCGKAFDAALVERLLQKYKTLKIAGAVAIVLGLLFFILSGVVTPGFMVVGFIGIMAAFVMFSQVPQ